MEPAVRTARADDIPAVLALWRSIYRLAVAPSQRHQGLGRRLVSEAEKRLAALGAVRLQAIIVQADARGSGILAGQQLAGADPASPFTKG